MYRRMFEGILSLTSPASSTSPHEELSQDFRFGRNLSLDLTLKPRTRTYRVGQSLCLPGMSVMGNLEPDLTGLVSLCVSQAGTHGQS